MKKHDIETIIRYLFRDNYPDQIVAAIDTAKEVAKGYWDVRTSEEEQRDAEAEVTLQDYEMWCGTELTALKKEAINN